MRINNLEYIFLRSLNVDFRLRKTIQMLFSIKPWYVKNVFLITYDDSYKDKITFTTWQNLFGTIFKRNNFF